MKKVLLLLVVMSFAMMANAQFDFCIGPKVGYQATELSVDKAVVESQFNDNKTFGAFARITIKKFFIQPELTYYKSGEVFDLDLLGEDFGLSNLDIVPTVTINQSNMAMPIYLGWQFIDVPFIKMRACAGPVAYFTLGQKEYKVGDETTVESGDSMSISDIVLGGSVGLGIDLWRFTLDVNYSIGLSDVFGDDFNMDNIQIPGYENIEIGVADDTKQNIFTVTLGFKLL